MDLNINILTAFIAGIISFISPCVFPLIPAYISYVSGTSIAQLQSGHTSRRTIIGLILFIMGFSLIFVLFGAGATFIGQFLAQNKYTFAKFAGIVIVLFGLSFTGVFNIKQKDIQNRYLRIFSWILLLVLGIVLYKLIQPKTLVLSLIYIFIVSLIAFLMNYYGLISFDFLNYEKKINVQSKNTYLNSFVLGISFAFGWTPCIGPILSAILTLAAVQETVMQGIILLVFYSLGLGIPFFVSGLVVEKLLSSIKSLRRYFRIIEVVSGLLLLVIGILIFTDLLSQLAYLFPQIELPY